MIVVILLRGIRMPDCLQCGKVDSTEPFVFCCKECNEDNMKKYGGNSGGLESLTFTIVEDEEGEWDYGTWDDPVHFHGKAFEEIRMELVKYVKNKYGNNTKFWIKLETDPRNWHL